MVCTESVAYQDLEYLNNHATFSQNNTAIDTMWLKQSDSKSRGLNVNAMLYHGKKMFHKSNESDIALSLDDIQHNDMAQK